MLGRYFSRNRNSSWFERLYIFLFGIPISGLRIRFARNFPLIKKYLGNSRTIIDIGTGRGVFALETSRYFPDSRVVGIDLDFTTKLVAARTAAVELGLAQRCHFIQADLFQLPVHNRFDAALAIDIIEHIPDDAAFCRGVASALTDSGLVIVHVPNLYRNLLGWQRLNHDIEGHCRPGYTMEHITRLLIDTGFTVVESGYIYNSLETAANDLSYLITKGREQNKYLYALIFPLILLLSSLGSLLPVSQGSGIYVIARK